MLGGIVIRLLAALAAFLFMGLWFLGADHGQFINPPRAATVAVAAAREARPVFIPAQRVMQAVAVASAGNGVTAQGAGLPDPALPDAVLADSSALPAQPAPQLAAIKLMQVPGGASVRAGPGREFAVIGDLSGGDAVMVIDATSIPGWVRIRVDGRGEGWVAARLLRE